MMYVCEDKASLQYVCIDVYKCIGVLTYRCIDVWDGMMCGVCVVVVYVVCGGSECGEEGGRGREREREREVGFVMI